MTGHGAASCERTFKDKINEYISNGWLLLTEIQNYYIVTLI